MFWNNKPLKVTANFIPRFFYTTASIDVHVDGRCVLKTDGPFQRTGTNIARFCEDGFHTVKLEWGKADWRFFPYRLWIDGQMVAESKVYIQNWPLLMVPYFLFTLAGIVVPHYLVVSGLYTP